MSIKKKISGGINILSSPDAAHSKEERLSERGRLLLLLTEVGVLSTATTLDSKKSGGRRGIIVGENTEPSRDHIIRVCESGVGTGEMGREQ